MFTSERCDESEECAVRPPLRLVDPQESSNYEQVVVLFPFEFLRKPLWQNSIGIEASLASLVFYLMIGTLPPGITVKGKTHIKSVFF